MTVKEFETLFDYGYWANRKLFDVIAELTDEGGSRRAHGVHHRGQLVLLLKLLGHTPGNFDILFYDERAQAERQA